MAAMRVFQSCLEDQLSAHSRTMPLSNGKSMWSPALVHGAAESGWSTMLAPDFNGYICLPNPVLWGLR